MYIYPSIDLSFYLFICLSNLLFDCPSEFLPDVTYALILCFFSESTNVVSIPPIVSFVSIYSLTAFCISPSFLSTYVSFGYSVFFCPLYLSFLCLFCIHLSFVSTNPLYPLFLCNHLSFLFTYSVYPNSLSTLYPHILCLLHPNIFCLFYPPIL